MRHRVWVGAWAKRAVRAIYFGFEPSFHESVVREVILDSELLRFQTTSGRNHIHVFRHVFRRSALDFANDVRIQTKLQDSTRAGLTGELGVDNFVGPLGRACSGDPLVEGYPRAQTSDRWPGSLEQ